MIPGHALEYRSQASHTWKAAIMTMKLLVLREAAAAFRSRRLSADMLHSMVAAVWVEALSGFSSAGSSSFLQPFSCFDHHRRQS